MRNWLEVLKIRQWALHKKLPRGIRKSINRYCMRNCQEVLENLSMRNWLKKLPGSIRKFVNEKLP